MQILWLVSVGNTDIQFPLHDVASGRLCRYELPLRSPDSGPRTPSPRDIHIALLEAVRRGGVDFPCFPNGFPSPPEREANRAPVGVDPTTWKYLDINWRMYGHDEPEPKGTSDAPLQLLCPKLEPLIDALPSYAKIAVLAINTARERDVKELLAAGPLAAKFLALRLGLNWLDGENNAERTRPFGYGQATWVDVLVGQERHEDNEAAVVQRIESFLHCLIDTSAPTQVLVTSSGGLPKLKELYPVLVARWFGRESVQLLTAPERERDKPRMLAFTRTVQETESLRMQAAGALARSDLGAALGAADEVLSKEKDCPWALAVRWFVRRVYGISMPGLPPAGAPQINAFEKLACRIESDLANGDAYSALVQLGTFVEVLLWERLKAALSPARIPMAFNDDLKKITSPDQSSRNRLVNWFITRNIPSDAYRIDKVNQKISVCSMSLDGKVAASLGSALGVRPFVDAYRPVREYRNKIVHAGNLNAIAGGMAAARTQRLFSGERGPFGSNFLGRISELGVDSAGLKKVPNFYRVLLNAVRGWGDIA